jgi:hypothetical protein
MTISIPHRQMSPTSRLPRLFSSHRAEMTPSGPPTRLCQAATNPTSSPPSISRLHKHQRTTASPSQGRTKAKQSCMHGKQRRPGTLTATGRFALTGFGIRTASLPTIKSAREASHTADNFERINDPDVGAVKTVKTVNSPKPS